MNKIQRIATTMSLMGMNVVMAFAQRNNGSSKIKEGLDEATTAVTGMFDSAVKLLYAVCAIMACIGAFNVYSKWSNGDPDVTKTAAGWIGGLVFVIVAIIIIQKVFLS